MEKGKGRRRRNGGEGWSWRGEAGARRCRCRGVVALGSLQDPRGMQEALVGCRGGRCREQLAWRNLSQVPQTARSILGIERCLEGVAGNKEKKRFLPSAAPHSGAPTTVPVGLPLCCPHWLSPTAALDCRDQHTGDARVALTGETSEN